MATLHGNDNSSTSSNSTETSSFTLAQKWGALGLSFALKSDKSDEINRARKNLDLVRELISAHGYATNKNLSNQDAIQRAEEQFVETIKNEYRELIESLLERSDFSGHVIHFDDDDRDDIEIESAAQLIEQFHEGNLDLEELMLSLDNIDLDDDDNFTIEDNS